MFLTQQLLYVGMVHPRTRQKEHLSHHVVMQLGVGAQQKEPASQAQQLLHVGMVHLGTRHHVVVPLLGAVRTCSCCRPPPPPPRGPRAQTRATGRGTPSRWNSCPSGPCPGIPLEAPHPTASPPGGCRTPRPWSASMNLVTSAMSAPLAQNGPFLAQFTLVPNGSIVSWLQIIRRSCPSPTASRRAGPCSA